MNCNVDFDDSFSKAINRLKCILPILVVAIHAYYPENNIYIFDYDISKDIMYFLSRIVTAFAVPCFFFISGYLFFLNNNKSILHKWKERIYSLLLPYLLWNSIYLLFQIAKPYVFSSLIDVEQYQFNLTTLLKAFWCFDGKYPIDAPLWYIRDLIIVCIFAPLIKKINNISPWIIFIWLGLIYIYGGSFYFCLGAWCITYKKLFVFIFDKKLYAVHIVFCILSFVLIKVHLSYLYVLYVFLGLFFALNLSLKVNCRASKILSQTSFWIYAIHALLISLVDKIIFKMYYPNNDIVFISYFFIKIFVTYLIAIGIYKILFKLAPNVGSILIGKKQKVTL